MKPTPQLIAVDVIIWRTIEGSMEKEILLVKRKNEPFKGHWALPGGFVEPNESLYKAAIREIKEETDLEILGLNIICEKSDPKRDPRGRVISICFSCGCPYMKEPEPGDDAEDITWIPVLDIIKSSLAFDHEEMVRQWYWDQPKI